MIVVFIGCSGVGKSTLMGLLSETRGFKYIRNIVTRYARPGEYHKTTLSEGDFNNLMNEGKIDLYNEFYGFKYGFLKNEIDFAVADLIGYYMIDFGVKNIDQLEQLQNVHKIILLPENREIFYDRIKRIRSNRFEEIKTEYETLYSGLCEGYNEQLKAMVIINKENQLGTVAFNVIQFLINRTNTYFSSSPLFRDERLRLIVENIKAYPSASNALEAYKILTDCIDNFEDNIWGMQSYSPPRTFLLGRRTDRLYTIFPESFFPVENYLGVTLLLSRKELIFISKNGAIEGQYKLEDDKYGSDLHFSERKGQVFLQKKDSYGDGVWHTKNK